MRKLSSAAAFIALVMLAALPLPVHPQGANAARVLNGAEKRASKRDPSAMAIDIPDVASVEVATLAWKSLGTAQRPVPLLLDRYRLAGGPTAPRGFLLIPTGRTKTGEGFEIDRGLFYASLGLDVVVAELGADYRRDLPELLAFIASNSAALSLDAARFVTMSWGCENLLLLASAPVLGAKGPRGMVLEYGSLDAAAFFTGPSFLVVRAGADDEGVNPSIDAATKAAAAAGVDVRVLDCPDRLNSFEFRQGDGETAASLGRIADFIRQRLSE